MLLTRHVHKSHLQQLQSQTVHLPEISLLTLNVRQSHLQQLHLQTLQLQQPNLPSRTLITTSAKTICENYIC